MGRNAFQCRLAHNAHASHTRRPSRQARAARTRMASSLMACALLPLLRCRSFFCRRYSSLRAFISLHTHGSDALDTAGNMCVRGAERSECRS